MYSPLVIIAQRSITMIITEEKFCTWNIVIKKAMMKSCIKVMIKVWMSILVIAALEVSFFGFFSVSYPSEFIHASPNTLEE